jgi:hypothetical protein
MGKSKGMFFEMDDEDLKSDFKKKIVDEKTSMVKEFTRFMKSFTKYGKKATKN